MVIWSALTLVAIQQAAEQSMSLEAPCLQSSEVVRLLGEKAGVELTVSGSVASDWLMVRFRDRPLSFILGEIARTLDAQWVPTGSRLELTPIPRTRQAISSSQAIRRGLSQFQVPEPVTPDSASSIVREAVELASQKGEINSGRAQELALMGPASRVLVRMVRSLGVAELSTLEGGERRVYAPSPIGEQRSLPGSALVAVHEFYDELAVYLEAFHRLGGHGLVPLQESPAITNYQQLTGPPAEVLLVIQRAGPIAAAQLVGVDAGGQYMRLGAIELSLIDHAPSDLPNLPEPLTRLNQPVTLPAGAGRPALHDAADQKALKAQIAEALRTWDTREALAEVPTEFMKQALAGLDADYAVVLPDSSLMSWLDEETSVVSNSALVNRMLGGRLWAHYDNGVLCLRPADLAETRRLRLPRPISRKVFNALEASGRATIDLAAELAAQDPTGAIWSSLWKLAGFAFEKQYELEVPTDTELRLLRLYAALAKGDREKAAIEPLNRSLGDWPQDLLPLLRSSDSRMSPAGSEPSVLEHRSPLMLQEDPSYQLALLDLGACRVKLEVRRGEQIFTWDSLNQESVPRPVELDSLVLHRMDRDAGKLKTPFPDRFAAAEVESLVLKFDFGLDGFIQHSFTIRSLPSGVSMTEFSGLPEKWRTKIDQRTEEAKRSFSGGLTSFPLSFPQ